MGNSLGIDLEDRVVIIRQDWFREGMINTDHPFLCGGGFGCKSYTQGRMIGGTFLSDGEDVAISGYDVERLATKEEIDTFRTGDQWHYLQDSDRHS